jgi:hypothetical protein
MKDDFDLSERLPVAVLILMLVLTIALSYPQPEQESGPAPAPSAQDVSPYLETPNLARGTKGENILTWLWRYKYLDAERRLWCIQGDHSKQPEIAIQAGTTFRCD